MKRSLFILLIISYLLFIAGTLEARQRGVQVRLSGQELFKTEPKNVVTTTFEVTNTSGEELEFISHVKLPEGWKLIIPSFPFRLAPNGTEIRLVGFFIPQTALAGKYEIIYRASSVKYPSISDFARIFVVVLSVTKLQAELLQAPESVIAGEPYEAIFSVINASNTENRVVIKVQSGQDLPYTVVPDKMTLAPGESKTVKVVVKTDEKLRKGFKHHLKLTVQSVEDEKIRGQARCAVDIIPKITEEVDRFHKIPAKIVLRSVSQKNEENNINFQGEFSGRGKLSEEGKDEIAFLFRGPDTLEDSSMFGQRDRYFAGYRGEDADVLLGDNYYSLSRLTEQSLDGRGAEAGLVLGGFGFRGYHMKTRWLDPEEKETALHFDYLFRDRYRIGLNLLEKKSDLEDAQIASLQGKLEPFENTNIEFEAAYGQDDNRHDNAYWLNLYGSPEWGGSYRLEYIYAEPDFPGYYQDKEYISGNFFFPIRNHFTLNTTLRQEKNNLDLDPSTESASLNRFGQLGLNYTFNTGTTLSIESRYRTHEDRLPEPDFNYRELTLKGRVGQSFKKLFFNASAESGKTKDSLKDQTTDVGIYEGTAYFMPTRNQTYGGYVRYSRHGDPEDEDRVTVNAGLTGSFQIAKKANLKLKLEKYDYLGTDSGDRHNFDLSLSYLFFNKIRMFARGRHTLYSRNSDQEDETAFIVEFTVPFGLPVGRKKSIGMLKGYVRDQETGQPVSDAILRLSGATAVTDSDGEFTFPALKPGTFYLNIDSASIGLERIPAQKTPMKIDIGGGKETSIEIGITRSAGLTGKIIVYGFAKEDSLQKEYAVHKGKDRDVPKDTETDMVEEYGLANVLLEFKSELETWRVLTDRKGRFSFDDVRPGQWTLTVHADNLPEYHYLEKDTFEIELAPGEKKEMLIRILPRKRAIQIIEEGETLIEEEKKLEKPAPAKRLPLFSVQVAACLELENAQNLVKGLKKKGYEAYIFKTRKSKKMTWHTVRIGDYTNKKEASMAASDFREKEKKDVFVCLKGSLFSVQVAACLERKNAQNLVKGLREKGYEAYIFKTRKSKKMTWYEVRIGDYASEEEASMAASGFKKKEKMDAFVCPKDSP